LVPSVALVTKRSMPSLMPSPRGPSVTNVERTGRGRGRGKGKGSGKIGNGGKGATKSSGCAYILRTIELSIASAVAATVTAITKVASEPTVLFFWKACYIHQSRKTASRTRH
jgi:hypothetical protein